MSLDSLQVDIAGFAETNLDWNNYENRDKCTSIFRKYWPQTKIGMASSTHKTNQFYQPGGVAMITAFPWASRSKSILDKSGLGRWVESEITGKANKKVIIISAYMVCKDSIERSGPTTAFSQQWKLLKEKDPSHDPDPRAIGFEDLKQRIIEIREMGIELIVMMDANDSLQNTRSAFTKWVLELNLTDPLISRHGTTDEPATYARGSKRIDYILASDRISEYITAGGILPLHSLCFSDHRALYIDIDLQGFLHAKPPQNMSRVTRGISSEDPRSVKKYQNALRNSLEIYNFESMIKQVEEHLQIHGTTEEFHEMLDMIDEKFTKARLDCEKESKSKFRHPWSPKLRDASYTLNYWNLWLSQKRQNKDFSNSRQRFVTLETEEYELDPTHSIEFIKFKLSQAQKNLKSVQDKAEDLRKIYLEEKATMYANEGSQQMEKVIRRIIFHEEQKRIFQKLKWLRGKSLSGGLDFIICTDDNGQEVVLQEPEEVFSAIMKHNIKHFSQADSTEFAKDPLKSILSTTGTNESCDAILNGSFKVEEINCSDAVKSILKQLSNSSETFIDDEISANDLIQGYRKWGEFTSTSPSGLHLSHERAVLRYMQDQREIAEATESPTLCDRVFSIKAKLIQFALKSGHVFSRWTKVVNAMIEKIPGRPLIHKLRVIHLIESDFNLLIGILWGRRLVKLGESMNMFDDGQGGSRPDRRTQELLIQKHLVYSTWRLAKINGSSFDNDAKSCFDRIVMPLASIASQQIGMPKRACELFLNTLNQMKYHIKTTAGISEDYYSTSSDHTIHGPGQGGRGSPCVWLVISSLIMKVMKNENVSGTFLIDPDRTMNYTQLMTGFVDDITHWHSTMDHDKPINDISDHMTYTAQLWNNLLSATGGKLELQKCFSYMVAWIFDAEGVAHMASLPEAPMNISLQDSESLEWLNISQRSPYDSHRTLGVMECPSGDYKDEFLRLMSKAKGFAQVLATAKLSRREAHILYFTTFIPSMNYSGAIGTLTLNQSNKIQGSVTQQFLSKMGYNRCLPSAVAYGPLSLGGVGLRDLFREQGTEKTMFILRLLRTNRPASQILRIQLAWAQLVSGISESILENTWTPLPHLDQELWISTLRQFLDASQLQIKIVHFQTRKPKCTNDIFLMEAACAMDLPNKTICMINRCRIYLRVETLSEVCSHSGQYIHTDALDCNENARIATSRIWPTQPRPGQKHRKAWKSFLLSFCRSGAILLETPLGDWNHKPIPKREGSSWFFDPVSKRALYLSDGQCASAAITTYRRYKTIGTLDSETTPHPDINSLIPADKFTRNGREVLEWRNYTDPSIASPILTTNSWTDYLTSIPKWEHDLILNIVWLLPTDDILSILQDEHTEILIVSDGGHSGDNGSFGWIISNQLLKMIEGHGTAPGSPMSSHRAEAFGKLSWLILLHHLTLFHNISIKCCIRSFCDNKAIVDGTKINNSYNSLYSSLCPNFDVLRSISIKQQQLAASSTNFLNTKHVKSHQDKVKPYMELTPEEILNIRADELATLALEPCNISTNKVILPFGMAYLQFDNQVQSSNEKNTLMWRLAEFKLQEYYSNKFGIKINQLNTINWTALRLARDRLTLGQRVFSIKHAIGWLATGNRMQMQGRILCSCTFCGEDEDTDHLYKCPAKTDKISSIVKSFQLFLSEIKTNREVANALSHGFNTWCNDDKDSDNDISEDSGSDCEEVSYPYQSQNQATSILSRPDIKQAYQDQDLIGWNLMVRGFLADKWSEIQENNPHPDSTDSFGDTWCSKVCLWLIQHSHELWIDRNNTLHQSSENNDSWKDREVRNQVRRMYDNASYIDEADRRIFNVPLETKLLQSTESLQAWVHLMDPIMKTCMAKQESRIRSQHRDIRSYFTATIPEHATTATHSSGLSDSDTQNSDIPTAQDHLDTNGHENTQAPNLSPTRNNPSTNSLITLSQNLKNPSTNSSDIHPQNPNNRSHIQNLPDINDHGKSHFTSTPSVSEDIYEIQPSGKLDPPDRVETPRVGDPGRAASHLRVG